MNFRRKTFIRIQPLGERLKRARRRKRLKLEEVENLTKIRARYIESLEKGHYTNLPSDVYVRGFLHTLCSLYKLDSRSIIKQYQQEKLSLFESNPKKIQPVLGKEIKNPILITPRIFLIILGVLAVLGIAGYLLYQVSGFAAAPKLEIREPQQTDLTIESDSLRISGKTDPGAYVTINEQQISLDLEGQFQEQIQLKDGLNTIKIVATNRVGKATTKQINVLTKIPQIAAVLSEKTSGLKLVLSIGPESSWVSVDADGKNLYKGIMLPKTTQEFRADKEIILSVGNAGSVSVVLNGKDLGILGSENEKKVIKYTPEDVK